MTQPAPDSLAEAFPKGTRVEGVVTRVEPFGVFVKVDGHPPVRGFIRPRDWSWSRRVFDLGESARPGGRVAAQVLGVSERGQLELSRKLTLPDPFPDFQRRHPVGATAVGQVSILAQQEKGVVVALEGGVEGFVPRGEIPAAALRDEGFGLLAQDWLAATVLGYEESRARLSVKEFLRARDRAAESGAQEGTGALRYHPALGRSLEGLRLDLELGELAEPKIDPAVRARIRRVLIVEDSENVSDSLAMVFEHFGFPCDLAASVDEGLDRLGSERYDLLILDVNLPALSGAELVARLEEVEAPAFVFVLTATAASEWARLVREGDGRVTCFFQKPTAVTHLFEQLELLARDHPARDDRTASAGLDDRVRPEIQGQPGRHAAELEGRISAALEHLKRETRASSAFVLAYLPGPRFERVAGELPELSREVQQALEMSPVGDVLRQKRHLAVADVARQSQRFKHLLKVLPVGSFAGQPLEHADQADYALFLVGEEAGQLRGTSEERLRPSALQIGHAIAQRRLDEVIAGNQSLLLTGFLSDSLLHEIKNELQALNDYAAVQLLLSKRHREDLTALGGTELVELKRSIVGIQGVVRRLGELVVLFRNLAGQPREEALDLNRAIERLRDTVKPFADRLDVTLETDLDPELPHLEVSPKLIDQPILNVMINGIEHMADWGGPRRRLRVATRHRPGDAFPVVITVADEGRGIHDVHREKIFDLFFTTKEHGTGMGLYIARFFIEQLGGRLQLRRSLMFAGSEFAIELPREVVPGEVVP